MNTQTLSRSVETHLSAQLKWNKVILRVRLKGYADLMWNVPACQHYICINNISKRGTSHFQVSERFVTPSAAGGLLINIFCGICTFKSVIFWLIWKVMGEEQTA